MRANPRNTGQVPPQENLRTGRGRMMQTGHHLNINAPAHSQTQSGQKTKVNLKVGMLNVCSKGQLYDKHNKWAAIHRLMRDKKLGILAIQVSHLTDEDIDTIHNLYGQRLPVLHSKDLTNTSAARGIAFILNREIVDIKDATLTKIIPGRAALLMTKWHANTNIALLNTYTPSNTRENEEFWTLLKEAKGDGHMPQPNVLLGDFNLVEDVLDRLPVREDLSGITEPTTCDYTFPQRFSETRSRLDRIYITNGPLNQSFEWMIESTGVPMDHRLASACLTTVEAPYIGKGRWTMPLTILVDQNFLQEATHLGEQAMLEAAEYQENSMRSEEHNPQITLQWYKSCPMMKEYQY